MPEDKKHQNKKGKPDPKEQRRPRHSRTSAPVADVEKKNEKPREKVVEKPAVVEPGPEFYKNLKRETDDILKITEEANSKYKKKEILSNWSKYEMPIESYDEMEEQENMGADYEKLIQAPLTVGGDFQFKHEKSWDINTAPSAYDKYFDIDMENLAIAIQTVPFHERNNLDVSVFSEIDLSNMSNRSVRYKSKYYNDSKKYSTPEMQIQDKIISNLIKVNDDEKNANNTKEEIIEENSKIEIKSEIKIAKCDDAKHHNNYIQNIFTVEETEPALDKVPEIANKKIESPEIDIIDDIDDLLINKVEAAVNIVPAIEVIEEPKEPLKETILPAPKEINKNNSQVIESPEDLEKWLDDFLED